VIPALGTGDPKWDEVSCHSILSTLQAIPLSCKNVWQSKPKPKPKLTTTT